MFSSLLLLVLLFIHVDNVARCDTCGEIGINTPTFLLYRGYVHVECGNGGKKKTENEKQNTCPVESENGPRTQDKDALMI